MPLSSTNRFEKQYAKKDTDGQDDIERTLALLEQDPKYPGLHAHRVRGTKNVWECYIDDSRRITFQYGRNRIILRNCCNHNITDRSP